MDSKIASLSRIIYNSIDLLKTLNLKINSTLANPNHLYLKAIA